MAETIVGGEIMKETFTVYFKALLKGNIAGYDGKTRYRTRGWNVHPKPDYSSVVCGAGFHLAKTLSGSLSLCKNAEVVWIARSGDILAQDDEKIRTDKCKLLKQVPEEIVAKFRHSKKSDKQSPIKEYRSYLSIKDLLSTIPGALLKSPPLPSVPALNISPICGTDWLEKHYFDISQEDIDNLKITLSIDGKDHHLRAKDKGSVKKLVKLYA
jgi:hypothetical protein